MKYFLNYEKYTDVRTCDFYMVLSLCDTIDLMKNIDNFSRKVPIGKKITITISIFCKNGKITVIQTQLNNIELILIPVILY